MQEILNKTLSVLKNGGTILYPTDTIWGIGCDATSNRAVEKIYKLKNREHKKSYIILVDSVEMIKNYVEHVPEVAYDILKSVTEPLTIVYPNARNLAKNVVAEDNTIAIRIVKENFCCKLITHFGKPIVSTSANISGEEPPHSYSMISEQIKNKVDYVVQLEDTLIRQTKPSTIIKLNGDSEFVILRS